MNPAPPSLKLNPSARISIGDVETTPSFLIEAPIKGTSLSTVRVSAENFPDAHAFLCSILIDGQKTAEISAHTAAELCRIGVFAPEDAMPLTVAYRFPIRSSAPGSKLSPRSSADTTEGQAALRMPAEWSDQKLQFEPHHDGSVLAPVQVVAGSGTEELEEFRQREPSARKKNLDEESTHAQFAREGYAVLKNLLPAEHVTELGRFFQSLAEQGFLPCNEGDGIRRFTAHNHPVARFWHDQLNERVSQLAARRTKPSYSFVSLYLAGGDLYWHTDRPPCEYTLALLLDYAPLDADEQSAWALKLKDREGTIHLLHQRIGEALIFKGRELMHGRDMLPNGHRSVSLLFHFVNDDYEGEMQ